MRRRPGRDLQAAATGLCQRALPVQENVFGTALLVVSLVVVGANRLLTVRRDAVDGRREGQLRPAPLLFLADATLTRK